MRKNETGELCVNNGSSSKISSIEITNLLLFCFLDLSSKTDVNKKAATIWKQNVQQSNKD